MRAGSKPIMRYGAAPFETASRHARFACGIARRYALRLLQRPGRLSLTFARRWALQICVQRHWHRSALTVVPRIEIRLQAMRRIIACGRSRGEIAPAVSYPQRLNPLRRMAETLIEHVKARARRVETSAKPSLLAGPIDRPVPRVLRRLSPVSFNAEAVDAGRVQTSRRSANRQGTSPGPGNPVTAAPTLDVDRLTEQVIQGIDRRIIAQRERLGRF